MTRHAMTRLWKFASLCSALTLAACGGMDMQEQLAQEPAALPEAGAETLGEQSQANTVPLIYEASKWSCNLSTGGYCGYLDYYYGAYNDRASLGYSSDTIPDFGLIGTSSASVQGLYRCVLPNNQTWLTLYPCEGVSGAWLQTGIGYVGKLDAAGYNAAVAGCQFRQVLTLDRYRCNMGSGVSFHRYQAGTGYNAPQGCYWEGSMGYVCRTK